MTRFEAVVLIAWSTVIYGVGFLRGLIHRDERRSK